MAIQYTTKEGDMIDWICWRYYSKQSNLKQSLLAMEPNLAESNVLVESQLGSLTQRQGNTMQGTVEKVLAANPNLVDYGPVLPAGVIIELPENTQEITGNAFVRLWDE